MIEKFYPAFVAYAILATIALVFTEGFTLMLLKIGLFLLLMTAIMSLWKSNRNRVAITRNYSLFITIAIFGTYSLDTALLYVFLPAMIGAAIIGSIYYCVKKS